MPEAIKNSDGTKKQDCEINAAKLLYIFQLVLELTDPLFQHCRKAARTHHALWVDLSALFRWFMFESFEHMLYYFLQENGHGPPVIIYRVYMVFPSFVSTKEWLAPVSNNWAIIRHDMCGVRYKHYQKNITENNIMIKYMRKFCFVDRLS